jgi:hypothetical protein
MMIHWVRDTRFFFGGVLATAAVLTGRDAQGWEPNGVAKENGGGGAPWQSGKIGKNRGM